MNISNCRVMGVNIVEEDEKISPVKSKTVLENEFNIRKYFRIFERDTFNDVNGNFKYNQDVIFLNENNNYVSSYQEYLKFGEYKLNQNGVFRIRTVWNGDEIELIINLNEQ